MPTSSTHLFRYQPAKVHVGSVYRYTKSNLDGSFPAIVSIYLPSRTHVEVIKREPNAHDMAYVRADMDWELFSAVHLDSYHMLDTGQLRVQAIGHHADDSMIFYSGDGIFPAQIGHYPAHIYNFDFTSLNLSLPHLMNPTANFEIGLLDPNWDVLGAPDFKAEGVNHEAFKYYGVATFEYVGEEDFKGTACYKYQVGGEGLRGETGYLWTDKTHGHFVNYAHPVADNPAWNSFKLELLSIETMTHGEWSRYMADELERAQTYTG